MLLILIVGALVVAVVVVLGLSICRVAALSDRNSALALTEWLSASRLAEHQVAPGGLAGEQFLFDLPEEVFRAAGWR